MQVQRQFVDVKTRRVVIELPESFVNHRVELIALTADDETAPQPVPRRRHPAIAEKGRTLTPAAWEGFADGFTGFDEGFDVSEGISTDTERKPLE